MFLMAEPLRNLGRFAFAEVSSYCLQATPIQADGDDGTLVVQLRPDALSLPRGHAA